jgi:hypothetical protein
MSIRRTHLAALFVLAALGLTGCGAGSGGSDAEPASDEDMAYAEDRAETEGDTAARQAGAADAAFERPAASTTALQQPAIIQVGTVTVQSDDVAAARFDLDKVVDAYGGSIADEKTTASTDGEVRLSRVVLRIPAADFDEAMIDVGKLGKVTGSTRKAEDVTGQIIDTQARIRAQEQSLQRVEVLFTRAQNIRDIVAIESQLSRRQAELDSLKGQLAYLEDQAAMSTLTVYLEPTPEPPKPAKTQQDDDVAFIGGLKDGWDALGTLGSGLATVAGALLPFAVVGLLVGVPGAVAARRWLARHPLRRPATEA